MHIDVFVLQSRVRENKNSNNTEHVKDFIITTEVIGDKYAREKYHAGSKRQF